MYGPPPHPRQVPVPAGPLDAPWAWLACLVAGVLLTWLAWRLRRRQVAAAGLFCAGQVVLLTAPVAAMLPRAVYGAYPTVDKQGSLLFYLEGVHRYMTTHPLSLVDYDPARLIGVHVGHLWVTELFDLVLPPHGAMGAQGLLYLVLAWWSAWWFLREVSGDARAALVLSMPFGLGLHLFRDLNWYTVEKAAVFALPLYATCWLRASRRGRGWVVAAALVAAGASFLNIYLGLLLGLSALASSALWAWRAGDRRWSGLARQGVSYGLTVLLLSPLLVAQARLLASGPTLATPECFLEARAALDTFTLAPLAWNRLEAWRALNAVGLGLAAWTLVRRWRDSLVGSLGILALAAWAVSLGPRVLGAWNPLYMVPWHAIPLFWRLSEPEIFFWVSWACLLALAARGLADLRPTRRQLVLLYAAMVVAWIGSVRTHPAYPGFSEWVPSELAEGWEQRLLQQRECTEP